MVGTIIAKYSLPRRGGILCLLSFFISVQTVCAQSITLNAINELESDKHGQILLSGFNEQLEKFRATTFSYKEWTQFFTVKVKGGKRPVLGSYEVSDSKLVFRPRFLPDPQVTYEVSFSSKMAREILTDFVFDADSTWTIQFVGNTERSAAVTGIFPASNTLPANVLRIYVEFSEPMSFDNPYDFIHLKDEQGELIEEPFVELEEGLWNSNRTRLTLLFHPGRIKRGVGPNMTMGEVFASNKRYTLTIEDEWNAGSGYKLGESYTKSFQIVDPVRETIKVENWKIETPSLGTTQPLSIQTNSLLDKALAERMISLRDEEGNLVGGELVLDGKSRMLLFNPTTNWKAGRFQLRINPKLEDVCGNTPLNVFDLEGAGQNKERGDITLGFAID